MTVSLERSYSHCRRAARRAASSFYLSFFLLPPAKRQAMYALYAFLRHTDDLGDSGLPVEQRREQLSQWREQLYSALSGRCDGPVFPALADTVARYQIPPEYLLDAIEGVQMDLEQCRYETFDQLKHYCHRVASVVGLACIHIWGFHSDDALHPARQCGLAFQLTNILRDINEDAHRNRIYVPREDLQRFGCCEESFLAGRCDDCFRQLMRFEVQRTEQIYDDALPLLDMLSREGKRTLSVMMGTYRQLLVEVKRRDGDLFSRPVRLSRWQKLRIAISGALRTTPWAGS